MVRSVAARVLVFKSHFNNCSHILYPVTGSPTHVTPPTSRLCKIMSPATRAFAFLFTLENRRRPMGRNMALRLAALVFSFVCCVVSQAPGDGDPLCVDEVIDGEENPFFALRPSYAHNVRPLMDSRDYIVLLTATGGEMAHIPWQQVDNDNNNTNEVVTEVSDFMSIFNRAYTGTIISDTV